MIAFLIHVRLLLRPQSSYDSEPLNHWSRLVSLNITMAETPTPPRRRDTTFSLATQKSFSLRRRMTKPFQTRTSLPSSKTCQEHCPSYRLKWETLQGWLETRYPDVQFNRNNLLVVGDKYIFEVPKGQNLTEVSLSFFLLLWKTCFE